MNPPTIGDFFATHSHDEMVTSLRHFVEERLPALLKDRKKDLEKLDSVKKRKDRALAAPSNETVRFDPRDNLSIKSRRESKKALKVKYEKDIEELEVGIRVTTNSINLITQFLEELNIRLDPPPYTASSS